MATEKCWFVMTWGQDPCRIDGPFGDDRSDAVAHLERMLKDKDEVCEAGAVFQLGLEEVRYLIHTGEELTVVIPPTIAVPKS